MAMPSKDFPIEYPAIQEERHGTKFGRGFEGENFQDKVEYLR